jgi:glycosyltransferase involved in cell wall biosynthesis
MSDTPRPTVLWAYEKKLSSWAYGINSRRIASRMCDFDHCFGETNRRFFDLKISLDIITHVRTRQVDARAKIVRIGGPGPLAQLALAREDRTALKQAFSDVAVVIALSPELQKVAREYHSNVVFILNGIDLSVWNSQSLTPRPPTRPFRAGMAASLKTAAQREVKGYDVARRACELAGVELLVVGRGASQVPPNRMIQDFYSQIDVLIHPVGPGKEASSNVIMESLALGIPVITTPDAGYHGLTLRHGHDALLTTRDANCLSEAIASLRENVQLRDRLSEAGRAFAESHHNIDTVSDEYERAFRFALATA